MPSQNLIAAFVILSILSISSPALGQPSSEATYTEPYRPQYHFSPATNWMNDPNGMVYYDGEYHLFYQHNPFGTRWGHMSWGHAVSRDLVHWEHLPVALPEADSIMIFSGSAVVDWNNSSGFGQNGQPPLVTIYTGHYTNQSLQNQQIAYSTDRGRTWTKYENNPVLDIDEADFRDPKVFWHEPTEQWVMVVVLSVERKAQFYGSKNLKDWTLLSTFGPAGNADGIWECPDLFELPVENRPGQTRWVLQVDLGREAVAGGSGGQYFVGDFDGTTFTPEHEDDRWIDYGKDFYAAVSWSDVPESDGRRLWLGWMNNWLYAQDIPTDPWRSAQSLPRSLTLRDVDGEHHLVHRPVTELERLRGNHHQLDARDIETGTHSLADEGIAGKTLELIATFEPGTAEAFGLKVHTGEGEETLVGYDVRDETVFVNRRRSGHVDFHPTFTDRTVAPVEVNQDGHIRLHMFIDWSSVEVFAGDGLVSLTNQVFPSPDSDGIALYAEDGTARLVSLEVWELGSIW